MKFLSATVGYESLLMYTKSISWKPRIRLSRVTFSGSVQQARCEIGNPGWPGYLGFGLGRVPGGRATGHLEYRSCCHDDRRNSPWVYLDRKGSESKRSLFGG